jgi:hypothetical protein
MPGGAATISVRVVADTIIVPMFKAWLVFLVVSFAVSIVALTYVQIRLIVQARTWRIFYERSILDLYWRGLSVPLRLLVWPGLVAFGVTPIRVVMTLLN